VDSSFVNIILIDIIDTVILINIPIYDLLDILLWWIGLMFRNWNCVDWGLLLRI